MQTDELVRIRFFRDIYDEHRRMIFIALGIDPKVVEEAKFHEWQRKLLNLLLDQGHANAIALTIAVLAPVLAAAEPVEDHLRQDAERWQAFISSARFTVMGAAGFTWEPPSIDPKRDLTNGLHFTLNIWDKHPAGGDQQGQHGRAMLMAYVDHRRAAAKS